MQFQQLNLIAPLLAAVQKAGYQAPSPIQEKTVPLVLAGKDVLGCAQTGTGKTAAFALPILQRLHKQKVQGCPIRALILTPTRELAIQIFENFELYGAALPLKVAVIFGGVNQNPQVEKLRRGVDILVATPGRLNDLIGQGHIKLDRLEIFVLDEADRMLDMGFIHDVKRTVALLPPKRQTLLFSATMPKEVEQLAIGLLTNPSTVKISPVTKTVDKISQSVYFVEKADKLSALLWLLGQHKGEATLVFSRTKHGANQVATKLTKAGVRALAIHGNKSQNARQEALGQFKAGKLTVLVATDIASRGIDVAELPLVINYNVPDTPEAYIHRIGRTGRAGAEGVAITLCGSEELTDWRDIEKHTGQSVPVGKCEWSVQNMTPVARPAPGGNRQPKKAEPAPEKAKKQDKQPPKKQREPLPQKAKQAPPQKETAAPAPKKNPAPPKAPAPTAPFEPPRDTRSSYGAAYAARYGGARPVRHFQSRQSLTPKAEDLPPPPSVGGVSRLNEWSVDSLPERRQIVDLPEPQPTPEKVKKEPQKDTAKKPAAQGKKGQRSAAQEQKSAPQKKENAPSADNGTPKKRRHRGGRRHKKPQNKGE